MHMRTLACNGQYTRVRARACTYTHARTYANTHAHIYTTCTHTSGTFPIDFQISCSKTSPQKKKLLLTQIIGKKISSQFQISLSCQLLQRILFSSSCLLTSLRKKLICPFQSAYQPHDSTETTLHKVTNNFLLALDSDNISLLTLLDPSASFDTVDHCILLNRLQHMYGISGFLLS